MVSCVWESLLNSQLVHSRTSTSLALRRESTPADPHPRPRERREHRVFQRLLQMIPGLEDRLMGSSADDVVHITNLVSHTL